MDSLGVGSAVSTGQVVPVSYWPGGNRDASAPRLRPVNPRVNLDIATPFLVGTVESVAYRMLADLVVVVHLVYLAFVAVGGALAWRWRRLIWPHLVASAVALVSVTVGFDCPLTNAEKSLRRLAGDHPYEGGFIDHYIVGTVFPRGYDRIVQVAVAFLFVAVYGSLVLRRSRASTRKTG